MNAAQIKAARALNSEFSKPLDAAMKDIAGVSLKEHLEAEETAMGIVTARSSIYTARELMMMREIDELKECKRKLRAENKRLRIANI